MGTFCKNSIIYLKLSDFVFYWKRRAPKKDEGPFDKFLEILDMGPIFTRNHEWIFGNMGSISTRKRERDFL